MQRFRKSRRWCSFAVLWTLRPWAGDDNAVSEPSSIPQLPEAPSTHSSSRWHMECPLLAALMSWLCVESGKGPARTIKSPFFGQHSEGWVAAAPTAWWDSLKLREEKLLCLSSSGSRIPGNPSCAGTEWELSAPLLSAGVRILHQPQGQSKVAPKYPGPDFLKEHFREGCGSQEVTGLKMI